MGGRAVGDQYLTLSQGVFPLPLGLPADMFVEIPDFRIDLSSTELRRRMSRRRSTESADEEVTNAAAVAAVGGAGEQQAPAT